MEPSRMRIEQLVAGLQHYPGGEAMGRGLLAAASARFAWREETRIWRKLGSHLLQGAGFPSDLFEQLSRRPGFDVRWPLTFACHCEASSGASAIRPCAEFLHQSGLRQEGLIALASYGRCAGAGWYQSFLDEFARIDAKTAPGVETPVIYEDRAGPKFAEYAEASQVAADGTDAVDAGTFPISRALHLAFFQLEIIVAFQALPHRGILSDYEEGILETAALLPAVAILREAAEAVPDTEMDWHCSTTYDSEGRKLRENRLAFAGRDLKQELLAFGGFLEESHRRGHGVQLRL